MREKLEEHARVVLLDVDSITPSPYQARKTFSEKEIKKLAVSRTAFCSPSACAPQ